MAVQVFRKRQAGRPAVITQDLSRTVRQQAVVEAFGFEAETDNIYHSEAAVTIEDPVMKRKILVEKENSITTVVWNPWIAKSQRMADFGDEEYHTMVCVEAANCSVGMVDLAPGAKHTLVQKISVIG